MTSLNWADWFIFAILAISCVFGLKRGLVKEVLSIVSWVAALVIAVSFKSPMASLLEGSISSASLRDVVAFAVLFIFTLVVGALLGLIVRAFIKVSGISTFDRMLGFVFGFARGCIVVMLMLMLVPALISIDQDQWWADSRFIPGFLEFEDWAMLASGEIRSLVGQSLES